MFEDLLYKKNINMAQLSQRSGVGYNYVFKIIKNQTDFGRCGIETANKLATALDMDLNEIYAYNQSYFQRKIYYQDQTDWDCQMYGTLNAELNKLFLIAIEYHFSPEHKSRDDIACKRADMEISCIKYEKLSEKTKCIMVAILNQQKKLLEFIKEFPNLKSLQNQKPLADKLYISQNPYNIFPAYSEMNIAY
ncbi:helix-turn-helix domain-containing protein [Butyrivibrio sp. XPD2002]|uniref:helix-turn-helix domain-containing protein n=1 Tax=Butyrivibrio sp. XPD2002 TaxID=1280665 RepID=UPI00041AC18A|nr:helix-turn-helix transcriptional regulator [Butyrivibrio sp. XPD2002]